MSRFTHPVSPKTSVLRPLAITAALLLQAACGGGGDGGPAGGHHRHLGWHHREQHDHGTPERRGCLGRPDGRCAAEVVDGTGTLVGSTTTNAADGSFALTLQPATGQLLLQAVGTDAAGQPLVLHGAVPALGPAMVANVTPLSDAILAVALGAEPRTVFAAAKDKTSALQSLAALTAASDFIKSSVGAQPPAMPRRATPRSWTC